MNSRKPAIERPKVPDVQCEPFALTVSKADLAFEVARLRRKYAEIVEPPAWMKESNVLLVDFENGCIEAEHPAVTAEVARWRAWFDQLDAELRAKS